MSADWKTWNWSTTTTREDGMVDRAAVLVRVEADDGYCTTPGDTPRRWLLLATKGLGRDPRNSTVAPVERGT